MRRTSLFLIFIAALGLALWGLWSSRKPAPPAALSLRVVATFYPLADFAGRIGGAHASMKTLTPPGAEPHEYEPTPQDVVATREADIVLMNGGIDAWLDRIRPDLKRADVRVVRVADQIPSIEQDPHVWLDPILAQQIVGMIRDAFVAEDPMHAQEYAANAEATIAALQSLDQAYRTELYRCVSRTIVASHDALGYLSKRYDLTIIPIAGLSPDEEPSAKRMAEIVDKARTAKASVIFTEELVSPKLAETIAREVGAETRVFDPIEGLTPDETAAGEDYFSIMRRNLDAFKIALQCT